MRATGGKRCEQGECQDTKPPTRERDRLDQSQGTGRSQAAEGHQQEAGDPNAQRVS